MQASNQISFLNLLLAVLSVFLFWQCQSPPHYQADISSIHIDPINIDRYEEVLFGLDPAHLREEIEPYIETFYFFLGEEINNVYSQNQLYDYITDPLIQQIYSDARERFPDLHQLEEELTEAFRYYRAHFPNESIPGIYSYVSGLDYHTPIKYADGHMAIGLDLYLGADYTKYRLMSIPLYQTKRMDAPYIKVDAMRLMGEKHIQKHTIIPETFLDFMIYEGKLLYFLDATLPLVPDSLKIGFTREQLAWMQNYRGYVWSYFIENEFLYSSDRQLISKFIGDAPFTSAFSRNSAPRTAVWIGWQIVREYMRRHPEVGLAELLGNADSAAILHASRYRGR